MRLLVVKTSSLGDVIHMLPAISDAVRMTQGLKIDWLIEESFASIPAWHQAVGGVIPIAMRRWKKSLLSRQTWKAIASARRALRQQSYDLVVDAQGLFKSAIWTRMAGGVSAGYDRCSIREPLASWFYERCLSVSRKQHAIERNRQLLALALGYPLPDTAPDYGLQGLAKRLPKPEIDLPRGSVVGLHGTSRDDKLWPIEGWIELARALAHDQRSLVLPWGNEREHDRAIHIAAQSSNVLVLPKLGLDDIACTLDQAHAVVGVDTGLLHLAAALGKPGLALCTATPPALTGAVSDWHAELPLRNLSSPKELRAPAVIEALQAALYKT